MLMTHQFERPVAVPLAALRVLVVDDEPQVGRTMAYAAEACGCSAALALSAESFRGQYERVAPQVVLLDLSLPGGDGIELLRTLAELRSQSLVMIVSGFDGRVIEAAMRLGIALGLRMGPCLAKPFTTHQLAAALAEGVAARPENDHDLCL